LPLRTKGGLTILADTLLLRISISHTPSLPFVGLVLAGKGVIRDHQKVITNLGEGEVTSGSFSPTMGKGISR
jgi:glycine cleavage system aminomethyltransferase T